MATINLSDILPGGPFESDLGVPAVDDYILTSKVDKTRVWVAPATAGAVTYSNVTSGLAATNVQAAVDELAEDPDGHVIEDAGTPVTLASLMA